MVQRNQKKKLVVGFCIFDIILFGLKTTSIISLSLGWLRFHFPILTIPVEVLVYLLDTIIGLPANLFYGTSIPTTILVLKKNRKTKDILFIDASNEFDKVKNQNHLNDTHIEKIITTYKERRDVDKYAHVASIEEIKENEYNLNIPRYVDTFEEEEPIDLSEVMKKLEQDNREIAELEAKINEQLKILGVEI